MDVTDDEVVPVLDLATVTTAVLLPYAARARRAWNGAMRTATSVAHDWPAAQQAELRRAAADAARYVWQDEPGSKAHWDRPALRVRRSLVQALPARGAAEQPLTAAIEQAAALPQAPGPLGRDAAILVASAEIAGLAQILDRGTARDLGRSLLAASDGSLDEDVAEFAEFLGREVLLRFRADLIHARADAVALPRLLRADLVLVTGPAASQRYVPELEAGIRDALDVPAVAEPGGPERRGSGAAHIRPVLPLLASTQYGKPWLMLGDDDRPALSLAPAPELPAGAGRPGGWPRPGRSFLQPAPPSPGAAAPPGADPLPAAPADTRQPADVLNVGVIRADKPARRVTRGPLRPHVGHLVWVSVGPQDAEAVSGDTEPLDLSKVPAGAALDVVVYPDAALVVPGARYTGSFVMGQTRPLPVLHAASEPPQGVVQSHTRLYFALRIPAEPGSHHVRILAYYQNLLLQARRLTVPAGPNRARLTVRSPYAVVSSLSQPPGAEPPARRLSVYVNDNLDGGHEFCLRRQDGTEITTSSAYFGEQDAQSLAAVVRSGLRQASWGDAQQVPSQGAYRYGQRDESLDRFLPRDTTGRPPLELLADDLCSLARSGYNAWESMTASLKGPLDREALRDSMRAPAVVELAPAHGSNIVPPLAGLYDIDLDSDPSVPLTLCPEAKAALEAGVSLADLTCFSRGCADASLQIVCPSGFWGLRHDIAVPLTLGTAAGPEPRNLAGPATPSAVLVGTPPDEVITGASDHATSIQARFDTRQSTHVSSRADWFTAAHRPDGLKYSVVYFLCHAKETSSSGSIILLGPLDGPGISRSNLQAYKIDFDQHPVVVLNACASAALEAEKAVNLVQGFTYHGASAVIGTEITVFTSLAYAFGVSFVDAFVTSRAPLGAALRMARLDLLRQWNPLGLVYVGYGLAGLRWASARPGTAAPPQPDR
ncbi:MAG TPA: CHAT domain-containing protein [Streptosporangiaceae bacterium]|nr:CHAT domain-containing protein [Streptosporangiaceae bacterium]